MSPGALHIYFFFRFSSIYRYLLNLIHFFPFSIFLPPGPTMRTTTHTQGKRGNIRELHWHPKAAEWALVLGGECFITLMDPNGKVVNSKLTAGWVWYFPVNWGHAIQVRNISSDTPIRRWRHLSCV